MQDHFRQENHGFSWMKDPPFLSAWPGLQPLYLPDTRFDCLICHHLCPLDHLVLCVSLLRPSAIYRDCLDEMSYLCRPHLKQFYSNLSESDDENQNYAYEKTSRLSNIKYDTYQGLLDILHRCHVLSARSLSMVHPVLPGEQGSSRDRWHALVHTVAESPSWCSPGLSWSTLHSRYLKWKRNIKHRHNK